jgi:hypothetical protein
MDVTSTMYNKIVWVGAQYLDVLSSEIIEKNLYKIYKSKRHK